MEQILEAPFRPLTSASGTPVNNEANSSGVSWAAVIGGGVVTAALSLILLALGTGLGLSSVSPWSNSGVSTSTLAASAIVWMILMQIVSGSMGGYLAGRLRTKWAYIHTDEVYFRDTAHGFLAWAVALVITAAFLASAGTAMMGVSASSAAGAAAGNGAAGDGRGFDSNAYSVDTLLRTENSAPTPATNGTPERGEVGRLLMHALRKGEIPPADRSYLAQLVATRTGLNQADADKRISEVFANAQQTAETMRRAIAHSLLWAFLALLIGAFCASLAATAGGRQRDRVTTT